MDPMWTGKREPRDSLRCRLANCCYTATRANAPLASASWSTLRAIPGHQLALISLASIRARLCRCTPLVGLKCCAAVNFNEKLRTSGRWRQQFPVSLAYAITIHKSQGMTLDRAVVDVKSRGFPRPLGLLYVALSRVRRLQDLMFFTDITLDDLQPRVSMQVERRLMDEQRRRSQVLMPPLHGAPVQTPGRHLDFSRALPDRSTPRQRTRDGTDFEPGSESRRLEFSPTGSLAQQRGIQVAHSVKDIDRGGLRSPTHYTDSVVRMHI